MKQYVDTNVATLNTTITNKVNDCSTTTNNKINTVQSNLNSLTQQHTSDMSRVDRHLQTIDSSVNMFIDELQETELIVASELQRCEESRVTFDYYYQQLLRNESATVAAYSNYKALVDGSINRLDASVQYLYNHQNLSAAPVTRAAAKAETVDVASPKKVEIELSELFGYAEGEQVNIDMRTVSDADSLYVIKGQTNVPVFQTVREGSENIIYYFDFIDSTGFRRQFTEIGMNEESNLVVISKKIVTICKIR